MKLKGSRLVKCGKCHKDNYLLPGTRRACSSCGRMLTGPAKKRTKKPVKRGKQG